jgi:peptidoglycan/LPS O-acetylase OafA/YrhL
MGVCEMDKGQESTSSAIRFDALDGARATAMLLGIFYHLPISIYTGGFGFGFGSTPATMSPKQPIDDWLHSFRMPLFFLISGFFAHMMLQKYGWKRFLFRRWWRIGTPLLVALLLLVTYRIVLEQVNPMAAGPFGMPAFGPMPPPPAAPGWNAPGPGFGPPAINPTTPRAGAATPNWSMQQASTDSAFGERDIAPEFQDRITPPASDAQQLRRPRFDDQAVAARDTASSTLSAQPRSILAQFPPNATSRNTPNAAAPPPPAFPFPFPSFPKRPWAEFLFGKYAKHLGLEHLWFLWYLLVFVTLTPIAVWISSRLGRVFGEGSTRALGDALIRFNLFGLVLSLLALPALIHARGFIGWTLTNPQGFMGAFPDCLIQYYSDEPFYFIYYLAGVWLYRSHTQLTRIASFWLWNLAIAVAAFAIAHRLSTTYSMRPEFAGWNLVRIGSFALYGLGTAYSSMAFIGFFQRFLNQPTRMGRYLADASLWIYLVHLPLIPYLIWWVQPASGPWWIGSLAGMALVTAVSLVMYELLVRPTPLNFVFGPAQRGRPTRAEPK